MVRLTSNEIYKSVSWPDLLPTKSIKAFFMARLTSNESIKAFFMARLTSNFCTGVRLAIN